MIPVNPILFADFYKVAHPIMFPDDLSLCYDNMTPRGSRTNFKQVMSYGQQFLVFEYLIRQFNLYFFERPHDEVMREYKRRIGNAVGPLRSYDHIAALHKLGYLPVRVKAIPEGQLVPLRVPVLTIVNTHEDFGWLPSYLETLISTTLWKMMTSATTAFQYRRRFIEHARKTGGDLAFTPWQGHDFSMRGMSGVDDAMMSGSAHLLSFTGTDTIPAIDFLELYYGANSDKELVGGSVPATEHGVTCVGAARYEIKFGAKAGGEFEYLDHLIFEVFPTGIISVVADTWDFWRIITEYLPSRRDRIMARDGCVVTRPDSGDPVDIICGTNPLFSPNGKPEEMGAWNCLWNTFGGTMNDKSFSVLDSHIGLIYGDSINLERQDAILTKLEAKGFYFRGVLGIGSYTYQMVTRDTYGFAIKATYCEFKDGTSAAVFKKPKTDDGTKNSARGLLHVGHDFGSNAPIIMVDGVDWKTEACGLLQTIFENGHPKNVTTLAEIRKRVEAQL